MLEKHQQEHNSQEVVEETSQLLLYNDDFNTFDHVIECLVEVCKYSFMQAEQYAVLVHYKGKATIKDGSYEELLPMYTALSNNNLTVELK